nr:MAG TPA: hypothetical protein [Caudoviricetes sp.]
MFLLLILFELLAQRELISSVSLGLSLKEVLIL